MKEYHKIQTVFLRDPETKFKTLLEGEFSLPEFELLKDIEWTWTEKIDGTNIRVLWNGTSVEFGGRTDKAQIPKHLLTVLQELFTPDAFSACFPESDAVCLYGEGFGAKIQKGHHYIPDSTSFILFDCLIDGLWLRREDVEDVGAKLGINVVPVIGSGPLLEAVEFAREGFKSTIAHNCDYIAEGLIVKPVVELLNRRGNRVVSKIKHRDFG